MAESGGTGWATALEVVTAFEQECLRNPDHSSTLAAACASCDFFAFGVLAYQIFTGSTLLRQDTDDNLESIHAWLDLIQWNGVDSEQMFQQTFRNADISKQQRAAAVHLVVQCVHPDPKQRPQSRSGHRRGSDLGPEGVEACVTFSLCRLRGL